MKILVYPKDTNNPYQKLLYGDIAKTNTVTYFSFPTKSKIVGLILFFPKIVQLRLQGYTIFHIHWLYELGFIFKNPVLAFLSQTFFFFYSLKFITFLKLLGFKIVWTVHNVSTHEKQTLNDTFISRYLAFNCSAIIVNSTDTISKLKDLGIIHKNISRIPIGNYIGYYKNTVSKKEAQQKLGIRDDGVTFLYFGQIRAYKGVDILIDSFEVVLAKYPNTQLIIAGSCNDANLEKKIAQFQKKHPERLFFSAEYIKDDEVQNYFKASDCVVLPFRRATTSSSVILALDFKKPIVYPSLANMTHFPADIGFKYNNEDSKGLESALLKAVEAKQNLSKLGENAFEFSKTFDWKVIQEQTLKVYNSL